MSATIVDRAWEIYRYMHPDAPRERKEQLEAFLRNSAERQPDRLLTLALAHLMKLDTPDD